ncbi:MAG: bifunctional DNA-formamidopyrimidine glycosylase/DNA-(apurinic or apyrimidinic site) lyase [Rhodospirillaceae bacterium]|nr:bifunctional DNA-formamidopyrimidine glycosylase/DNA-(apurinic or apyrimidinic site) lyase [Rhodospirillaceae bacterium]
MPELPEVETTRRGLEPLVVGQTIRSLAVREPRLRWPVEPSLDRRLRNRTVQALSRRGKYLLLTTDAGSLLVHLGMSGNLRFLNERSKPARHDHFDLEFVSGAMLRFNDPRRFGSLHWSASPEAHWLLKNMGPEPLGAEFSGDYLWRMSRGRRVAIKTLLMNGRIVAGLGNIYANEALFRAGIHPTRPAGRVSRMRLQRLADTVGEVLREAIQAGGTTLQDFVGGDGKPGYFQLALDAYGRAGEPCVRCERPIRVRTIGQRATYYCANCQR